MSTIALHTAVGLRVRCPDPGCGAPSVVLKSRAPAAAMAGLPPPPGVAPAGPGPVVAQPAKWCIVQCPRGTGAKLFPGHQPVEVISDGG